jgi:hypothetical protein
VCHVGLPFRRPCQHTIEDCFDLFFCHALIIAEATFEIAEAPR